MDEKSQQSSNRLKWQNRVAKVPPETINQWTHGAGFLLSVIGSIALLWVAHTSGNFRLQLGCWIYVVTLVLLYAASTLSHSFLQDPLRNRFRTLDQVCIFLMIAGNYTPVGMIFCQSGWSATPLYVVWALALVGCWVKLYVTKERMVPLWFYVCTSWIPSLAMLEVSKHIGWDGMCWVFAGAASYCLGVVFFANDHKANWFHGVWHLLVIGGSACHYVVVYKYTALAITS